VQSLLRDGPRPSATVRAKSESKTTQNRHIGYHIESGRPTRAGSPQPPFHAKLNDQDVNILFTSVGNFLTVEAEVCLSEWRAKYHIVKQMPMERVTSYLRFDQASGLALVDAIVCMADPAQIAY
jgi:hypothetical protein